MKSIITDYINKDKRYEELNDAFGQENVLVTGLSGAVKATMMAEKYLSSDRPLVVVTNNLYQADKLEADIQQYINDDEIYKYPLQDIMTEEFSTQSPQLMSERVRTYWFSRRTARVLYHTFKRLKKLQTPVDIWQSHQLKLSVGDDIDVDDFLNKLVDMVIVEKLLFRISENSHYAEVSLIFIR